MTNEEAIFYIKELQKTYASMDKKVAEAVDMAIEALSANDTTEKPNDIVEQKNDVVVEPTDLISRADAINAIESRQTEQWIDADVDYNNGLESAVAEIKALPSAEQVTGKLNNPCDSLLKADSEDSKEQKSKLDLISRGDLISDLEEWKKNPNNDDSAVDLVNHFIGIIKAAPSADSPTEPLKDGTLKVNVKSGTEVNRVLVWGDDGCGGLYYADDRPNIAYFCDGAACDGECNECHHTTDIKHAKNFNIIGGKYNIKYIETDYRPSGEWIYDGVRIASDEESKLYWKCSECGHEGNPDANYCGFCGAKMGGDAK